MMEQLDGIKTALASWLSKKLGSNSAKTKKGIVIGLCLYSVGYLLVLSLSSINTSLPLQQTISVPTLAKIGQPSDTKDAYGQIQEFRRIMDSLGKSETGIAVRDSILKRHPGIMDTIARMGQIIKPFNH